MKASVKVYKNGEGYAKPPMAAVKTRFADAVDGALWRRPRRRCRAGCQAAVGERSGAILRRRPCAPPRRRRAVAGKAVLYRDQWGVPHVYAAREEDGYFGLG